MSDLHQPIRSALRDPAVLLAERISGSRIAPRITDPVVVKANGTRIVARARFDGRPCYVKAFIHRAGSNQTRAVEAELAFAARSLRAGPFRAVRCLFAARRQGFVVTTAAPGRPLQVFLRSKESAVRERTVTLAGEWLAAYCHPRREGRRFDASRFLRLRSMLFDRPAFRRPGAHEGVVARLGEHMARQALALDGQALDIAASHGDFIPRNLHRHGDMIHAFDIDGYSPRPVAEEVAHFLAHVQLNSPDEDALVHGVNRGTWNALRASGVLPTPEWETTVPLYLAMHLERVHALAGHNPRVRARVLSIAASHLSKSISCLALILFGVEVEIFPSGLSAAAHPAR